MGALVHGSVEVGTEPTRICTSPPGSGSVMIQNTSGQPLFVGGPTVAVSGEALGLRIKAEETTTLSAIEPAASDIYGVVADGTAVVVYLFPG